MSKIISRLRLEKLANQLVLSDYQSSLIIFAIGIILRLIYVLSLTYEPYSDMTAYVAAAQSIALGQGFPARYSPAEQYPLYTLFLSGFFSLFGQNYMVIRVAQSALGAITGILVYFLTKRIFGKAKLGLWAGLGVAIYPDLIVHAGSLLTETLYTFVLISLLLTWQIALDRRTWGWQSATGILIGLTYLARSASLIFILLALLWSVAQAWPQWRGALRATALMIVVAIIVCLPWLMRNQAYYGRLHPPYAEAGFSLWIGNNANADGSWVNPYPPLYTSKEQEAYVASLSVPEQQEYMTEQAVNWIKQNPIQFAGLAATKISRAFGLKPDGTYKGNFYGKYTELLIPVIAKVVLWIFALVGLVYTCTHWWRRLGLLYALLLSYFVITIMFFAYARYLVPLIPILIVWAVYGGNVCIQTWKNFYYPKRMVDSTAWVAIVLIALLIANWGWDTARNLATLQAWQKMDSLTQCERGVSLQKCLEIPATPISP